MLPRGLVARLQLLSRHFYNEVIPRYFEAQHRIPRVLSDDLIYHLRRRLTNVLSFVVLRADYIARWYQANEIRANRRRVISELSSFMPHNLTTPVGDLTLFELTYWDQLARYLLARFRNRYQPPYPTAFGVVQYRMH